MVTLEQNSQINGTLLCFVNSNRHFSVYITSEIKHISHFYSFHKVHEIIATYEILIIISCFNTFQQIIITFIVKFVGKIFISLYNLKCWIFLKDVKKEKNLMCSDKCMSQKCSIDWSSMTIFYWEFNYWTKNLKS